MKRIALIIAAAVLTLGACKPEIKPIGPAYEAGAGIIGTWELTGADQTDLTLPVPETRDISSFYTNAASIWSYDTPEFPTALHLMEDTVLTVLPLGNMPRSIDQNVSFVYDRERCDKPSVSYKLTLTRK